MRHVTPILAAAALCSIAFAGGGQCPGDANGDNVTDINDYSAVIVAWGTNDAAADVNDDGTVDINDLALVVSDWGCVVLGPTSLLTGTVTNAWTGDPIEGASVEVDGEVLTTDASGVYSGSFASGLYDVTVSASNFNDDEQAVILFPDLTTDLDVPLVPVAPVIVTVELSGDPDPDGMVSATAIVEVFDGSSILDYAWMQLDGIPAILTGDDTDTVVVDLPDELTYKERLITVLSEPPIGPEQLPPNVPLPEGEFPGGLQSRFQLVGINPFALEETGLVELEVEVTTTSGNYFADSEVHTNLQWRTTRGIRNVPIEIPVLLYGKDQVTYDWQLTKPGSSSAALVDETTRSPHFTPDVAGVYDVTVTDEVAASVVTLTIYAGNWGGVVIGQDAEGRPTSDPTCVGCHTTLGVDKFTPWSETGHAAIFTDNINSSPYWGPQCFQCHTVGYDLQANNGGIDESPDYQAFLSSGLIGNPSPDNWTNTLGLFPSTALQANAQCDNCHGPQFSLPGVNTLAHGPAGPVGEPRQSLSSDVCTTCHGEPLRHARFQQWQLSGHANYEVAIDEGDSGNCSRCHTANGFLTWLPVLNGDEPGDPLDNITVTWTADETHPQTCVTCHDPHVTGTSSGLDTDAVIRISGDTPPLIAGFTAYAVGRGAMCMTCHNSRRGLRNDSTYDSFVGTSEVARAPHGSAQTDLIMGENAYLVSTGIRGNHSFLTDTCVQCHMEETPPPDALAYNLGGTNHTFYASDAICTQCHTGLDGPTIQAGVESTLHVLQDAVEEGWLEVLATQTGAGNIIDLNGDAMITDVASIAELEFGEFRGRQSLTFTFTDESVLGPYRIPDIDVLDGSMVLIDPLYDFADEMLLKAGWNWGLVHNDGSLGVHNPTYAYNVMTSAITILNPAAAAELVLPDWLVLDRIIIDQIEQVEPAERAGRR